VTNLPAERNIAAKEPAALALVALHPVMRSLVRSRSASVSSYAVAVERLSSRAAHADTALTAAWVVGLPHAQAVRSSQS
jgi:hypothetical protein